LTNITIPGSVTNIGDLAFAFCRNLTGVFFTGDPPIADSSVFLSGNNPTVYYLPGMTGWSSPFASREAVLWNPQMQTSGTNFGVQSNQFGFNIVGTPFIPIVVETSTNLASRVWIPLQTLTLTNGSFSFSDSQWTNFQTRYYRLISP
jgi:hypothetical protein